MHYYISPQLWAWKKGRIKTIRECVDRLYCILPFEKDFYAKEGLEVDYVGHPLLDALASQMVQPLFDKPVIALLPGSRKQEISKMLPVMLETVKAFPAETFVVAGAPTQEEAFYRQFLKPYPNVQLVQNQTYPLLASAKAALVTSGTATLETALWNVPEVVCYAGGWLSFQIAKRIVDISYISLVNLILDRPAVTELIQDDLSAANLIQRLQYLLSDSGREQTLADYAELRTKLGGGGASANAAPLMLNRVYPSVN